MPRERRISVCHMNLIPVPMKKRLVVLFETADRSTAQILSILLSI